MSDPCPYNCGNSNCSYRRTLDQREADTELTHLREENQRLKYEQERSFQLLQVAGIPRERARYVDTGINVLTTRYLRGIDELAVENQRKAAQIGELEAIVFDHGPDCIAPDEVGASGQCVCGNDRSIARAMWFEKIHRQAARIAELEQKIQGRESLLEQTVYSIRKIQESFGVSIATSADELVLLVEQNKTKLAAFEDSLAEVRAERPEVARFVKEWEPAGNDLATNPELADHSAWWANAKIVTSVIQYITELQRAEAAWRSARDIWQAEKARLNEMYEITIHEAEDRMHVAEARVRELEAVVRMLLSLLSISDTGLSKQQQAEVDAALALPQTEQNP